jgi:23S rRNA (uracil1939-C5)-methyltransferase
MPATRTPAVSRLDAFARAHGVQLALPNREAPLGFRHRARLAVRGRAASPKLGIFQLGTHRIVDIPNCLVHHPAINEVARALRAAIRATDTMPYVEAGGRGLLRYVQLVVERATGRVQVVLVVNSAASAALEPLTSQLIDALGARLQGLWLSPHTELSNRIMGTHFVKVCGEDAVRERVAGTQLFFPPDAFGQSHLDAYEGLVQELGAPLRDGLGVLELYAGVGGIGLSLLPRSARVCFNEIAGGSLRGLELALAQLPEPLRARSELCPGSAAELAPRLRDFDVVIADPPRRGLDAAVLEGLCARGPARFVYVSCGLDSFLADATALLAHGYRLESLAVHDMFPHSGHVETLAHFVR